MNNPKPKTVLCLFFDHAANDTETLESLAEACYRFTPLISVRESEAVFLDLTKSLTLFKPEIFHKRIEALCRKFSLSPKLAFAEDAGTALSFARYGTTQKKNLPIEALAHFISPFESLSNDPNRLSEFKRSIAYLKTLGIKTVGQFEAIPIEQLVSRLGRELMLASKLLMQGDYRPWPVFHLREEISEKVDLFETDTMAPCSAMEPLLFLMRAPLDRMTARLRARGDRLSKMEITLELSPLSEFKAPPNRHIPIEFSLPQGSSHGILSIVKRRLEASLMMRPLASPVVSITVTVTEKAPGLSAQKDFFRQTEVRSEAWASLVARLMEQLGKESVFQAKLEDRFLPEKAWSKQAPKEWPILLDETDEEIMPSPLSEQALGLRFALAAQLKRPSRLLPEPEPIRLEDLHAQSWSSPERIQSEWWNRSFERDYFQVLTQSGQSLWVYRPIGGDNRVVYLHGFFD